MPRSFDQCPSVGRKKVLFGVALIYALAFLVVQYRYGWSFVSVIIGGRGRDAVPPQEAAALPDLELNGFANESLDIHFEDPNQGHTGEVIGHGDHGLTAQTDTSKYIAIGGGITSKKLVGVTKDNIKGKFQFFSILMPSFCKTVTTGYSYHFYLAYDNSDPVFSDQSLLAGFKNAFFEVCHSLCPQNLNTSIHFVQCSHQGRPAWAQNDAMIEAYLDGMEYFYRVNDDSILESSGWTDEFIKTLAGYDPPNVGVVGPRHVGGNEQILTYDFVQRTHVELFGFYYPRVFTDWYADDWVTKVYEPNRMTKLSHIHLKHTMTLGQRYRNDFSIYPKLESQLRKDKAVLERYISYKKQGYVAPTTAKVVAMSVYGNNPKFTMGAIRNAQIIPVFFPGWTLRVYVARPSPEIVDKKWNVPERIIMRLKRLGVQIVYVDTTKIRLDPMWWGHLVADDSSVDYFVVRRADGRLSDRDASAVVDFVEASNVKPNAAFHCIRDHPSHAAASVVDGLWGGKGSVVREQLKPGIHVLIQEYVSNHSSTPVANIRTKFLSDVVWPLVKDVAYCHDSIACKNWSNAYSFPAMRSDSSEYVGQKFNEHQEPIFDLAAIDLNSLPTDCNGKGKWKPAANITVKIPTSASSTLASVMQPSNMTTATQLSNTTAASTPTSSLPTPTAVTSS